MLANLLAAPLVAPTTIVGVAVALTSVLWVTGAGALAWGAGVPAQGIAWVARWCAELHYCALAWGDSAAAAVGLAVVTGVALLVAPWVWHRSRTAPLVAVLLAVVTVGAAAPTRLVSWPPAGWVSWPATWVRGTASSSTPAAATRSSSTRGRTRPR